MINNNDYNWVYMQQNKYLVRQKIAQHFIPDDIELVLEIGPGTNPIQTNKDYIAIEALEGNKLEDFDSSILDTYQKVAIIWIGIDTYIDNIENIVKHNSVKLVILEASKSRHEAQIKRMQCHFIHKDIINIDLNLGYDYWDKREMFIYNIK